MKRLGVSKVSLIMAMLLFSILLLLLFSGPLIDWFSESVERAYLVGGQTSIEVVAASGIGTDEPLVYVRNLGPRSITLGYEKKRDPSLWQVFIGNENLKVVEVQELGKEDNVLGVYEFLCLKLEPKKVSKSHNRIIVYGPGATMADPPVKAEKATFSGKKSGLSSAWKWIKGNARKIKDSARRFFSNAKQRLLTGYNRFKARYGEFRRKKGGFLEKFKNKVGSAKHWCKRHKKELAVLGIGAAAVLTVLTLGLGSPALGAAVTFGGWGLAASTASFAGLVSAPPLVSGIAVGTAAALVYYGALKITRIPKRTGVPRGPSDPFKPENVVPRRPCLPEKVVINPKTPKHPINDYFSTFKKKFEQKEELSRTLRGKEDGGLLYEFCERSLHGRLEEWKKESGDKIVRRDNSGYQSSEHKKAVDRAQEYSLRKGEYPEDPRKWFTASLRKAFGIRPDYEARRSVYEAKRSTVCLSRLERNLPRYNLYAEAFFGKDLYLVFDKPPTNQKVLKMLDQNFIKVEECIYKKKPGPWVGIVEHWNELGVRELEISLRRNFKEYVELFQKGELEKLPYWFKRFYGHFFLPKLRSILGGR